MIGIDILELSLSSFQGNFLEFFYILLSLFSFNNLSNTLITISTTVTKLALKLCDSTKKTESKKTGFFPFYFIIEKKKWILPQRRF